VCVRVCMCVWSAWIDAPPPSPCSFPVVANLRGSWCCHFLLFLGGWGDAVDIPGAINEMVGARERNALQASLECALQRVSALLLRCRLLRAAFLQISQIVGSVPFAHRPAMAKTCPPPTSCQVPGAMVDHEGRRWPAKRRTNPWRRPCTPSPPPLFPQRDAWCLDSAVMETVLWIASPAKTLSEVSPALAGHEMLETERQRGKRRRQRVNASESDGTRNRGDSP